MDNVNDVICSAKNDSPNFFDNQRIFDNSMTTVKPMIQEAP